MTVLGTNSYSCSTEVISGSFERQLVLGTRKKEEAVNIYSVSFFLSSNMKSYLGDVVTNCSEYLWLHKHTNAVDRNPVSFVPTTPISLYNNFLRYFFRLGKQNTLQ